MAAILLETNKIHRSVRYFGLEESRFKFKRYTKSARTLFWLSLVSFMFSPYMAVFFLCLFISKTANELFGVFFKNEAYMRQYNAILQPQTAKKVVSVIGYRIYNEELDGHLSIIKSGDKGSLAAKQKTMEHPHNKLRHIGIDMDLAKTHMVLVGKTGAGKTEALRSIMDDIMKIGGGIVFNDGKSDVKMLDEILAQAKSNYRETSVRVLNFLKAEKSAESNTFNFFNNQHPVKLIEFLSNLAFKESSEGNTAYFQNRGKALLLPVASALYIRDKLLGEGIDSEKLSSNTSVLNVTLIFIAFYCMCRDLDEIIAENKNVEPLIKDNSIVTAKTSFFDNIERLIETVIQEPTRRIDIEKELGIEYSFIKDTYTNVYKIIRSYLDKVWNRFIPILDVVALVVYSQGKSQSDGKKKFYSKEVSPETIYSMQDIKIFYNLVKEAFTNTPGQNQSVMPISQEAETLKNNLTNIVNDFSRGTLTISYATTILSEAFTTKGASLENPPADNMMQHSYAQQQWEQLFNVFAAFKHILAQSKSEINPVDVIADNQILYVLLPPLELSRSQVEILGKIIIATIKAFAGSALGGEYIGIHQTIKNIAKDKFTPKPFTLINLDEYGAYPVADLDTILAQVRSLNMSVALGIQDFVSLKASGTDETAQKRALANTSKIIFKVADKDVIEWLETMTNEEEVESSEYKRDAAGELVLDVQTRLENKKIIPIKKTQDANNGLCLMLLGAENDRAVWCQTFFRGGKTENVRLIHTNAIAGISSDVISNMKKGYEDFKDEIIQDNIVGKINMELEELAS